ncbi:DUF5325 family protein [Alteribacillus sp. HJP-4]|uniref:DUF5325 family protein n=1 Tax=Alteribacillus sp. HJP-4 TaxID=2775394 RepID=UPI0035CCECC7
MNREKVLYLLIAVLATLCISAIGVAIAERSWLITALSLIGMYAAFAGARKLRSRQASGQ